MPDASSIVMENDTLHFISSYPMPIFDNIVPSNFTSSPFDVYFPYFVVAKP